MMNVEARRPLHAVYHHMSLVGASDTDSHSVSRGREGNGEAVLGPRRPGRPSRLVSPCTGHVTLNNAH